jgi:hypothetical protein
MLNEAASAAEEQRSRPSGMVCFFIAFVLRVVC